MSNDSKYFAVNSDSSNNNIYLYEAETGKQIKIF